MTEVIWAPQPGSQDLFISCPIVEVLYEGTRGPGKTDALLMDFAQHVGKGFGEAWRGILFREEAVQLEDIITKSKKWYPRIFPGARFVGQPQNKWVFPDGEELLFRHMRKAKDYWKYHGHEYPWIGWEELTNWVSSECYDSMKSCCRSSHPGVPRKYRATCNPYGPGHHWVKQYFIDVAPAGVPVNDNGEIRVRIHGSIEENRILLDADPGYIGRLEAIKNKNKREAWRYGSWNIVAGAFFDNWSNKKHVLRPFALPKEWKRFRSGDWGSAKPFSFGWWGIVPDAYKTPCGVILPRGSLVRYREWYGQDPDEEPNTGVKLTARAVAQGIKEREKDDKISHGILDPSAWSADGGPSIEERMRREYSGCKWRKADNARVARKGHIGGWDQVRDRLDGEGGSPLLYFFDTCLDSIRTIPVLQHDETNPEDLDTTSEDHAADEVRYACMSRPLVPRGAEKKKPKDRWDSVFDDAEKGNSWKTA